MKKTLALILALVMAFVLAACGSTAETAASPTPSPSAVNPSGASDGNQPSEPKDTTLVVGVTTVPGNFDPFGNTSTRYQCKMIFETLAAVDPYTGEYVPQLATSWEWLDNLTLQINLRDDVYFTDGQHMTSSDVMYSLRDVAAIGGMGSRFIAYDWDYVNCPGRSLALSNQEFGYTLNSFRAAAEAGMDRKVWTPD